MDSSAMDSSAVSIEDMKRLLLFLLAMTLLGCAIPNIDFAGSKAPPTPWVRADGVQMCWSIDKTGEMKTWPAREDGKCHGKDRPR